MTLWKHEGDYRPADVQWLNIPSVPVLVCSRCGSDDVGETREEGPKGPTLVCDACGFAFSLKDVLTA